MEGTSPRRPRKRAHRLPPGLSALVICTATGGVVAGSNLRRVLRDARSRAGLDEVEGRLSLHTLRHGMLSVAATDMALPATTLAAIAGHADPATTFRLYSRDSRDSDVMVADVLKRAAGVGVGTSLRLRVSPLGMEQLMGALCICGQYEDLDRRPGTKTRSHRDSF